MKKKDDINENSIDDLIHYDEDDFEEDFVSLPDDFTDNDISKEYTTEEEYIDEYNSEDDEEASFAELSEIFDNPDFEEYNEDDGGIHLTKKGVLTGIVIGVVFVLAFVAVDKNIIGNYKNNFSNNISKVFKTNKVVKNQIPEPTAEPIEKYKTDIAGSKIISLEGANEAEFVPYRGGIVCAKMNYMSFIDETGTVAWETDTAIVNPILKSDGGYILLAENGRNKICLYSDNELLYDIDDANTITAAELSSNGDVIVVTSNPPYRGGVSVYNKEGRQIYSWSSGADAVICADISYSRRIAVTLLNSTDTLKSTVLLFNVNDTESYAKAEIEDTVVYELDFTGGMLNVFGDNRLMGISESGKIIFDTGFENGQLVHSAVDNKGNKLLSFDDGNAPLVNYYNKKGVIKDTVMLGGTAECIDVNGKYMLYGTDRDIYFGKQGSPPTKYTAAMDIKKLVIATDKTFAIVYSNSIEYVTVA